MRLQHGNAVSCESTTRTRGFMFGCPITITGCKPVDERPKFGYQASHPGEAFLNGDGKTKKVSYRRTNIYDREVIVHYPGCIELATAYATKKRGSFRVVRRPDIPRA
jgi:hypothetical protein